MNLIENHVIKLSKKTSSIFKQSLLRTEWYFKEEMYVPILNYNRNS
jgi:hypothetical protein